MSITKEIATKFVSEFNAQDNVQKVSTPLGDIDVNIVVTPETARTVVEAIVNACFDEDGTYRPDMIDVASRIGLIAAYTDVEMPENFEDKCTFVFVSGIFEAIVNEINCYQRDAIMRAVDETIRYRIRTNTNAIESSLITAAGEMNAVIGQFKEMYAGVSGDDMKALIGAISNTKLDEKKLVKAITDKREKSK